MVRRYSRALVRVASSLVALGLLWPDGLVARQEKAPALPSAREVIDRFVKATGGSAAFKGVSSMRARGTFTVTGQQHTGEVEMMAARPNKLLTRINITGLGKIEEGFDGKVGWSMDPFRGPALVTGRGLEERADEAWFDAPLHGSDHVKEMSVVGKDDMAGRPVYRLKVVTRRGSEQFEFFDAENGFQIGMEATRDTPFGSVPTTTIFRDYQRFGLLTFPSKVIHRVLGQEQIFSFSLYEFNVLPSSTFELPPAIKALVK
jgi:hypothetical protein